ncbi:LLM class F420-dependent oxidoreductase [Myxococcota bacterium]|nr:LLM class F420-dependent oxidoreductase [Myxococcota bacterium]
MRLTFKTRPQDTAWPDLLAMWLEAEQIEALDGGFLYDHFYPIYGDSTGPCFEGWTALAYLAGRTQRLRLGLMVTGNPYRHPAVLANMAATFDVVSGGRLDLGLGAGWNEEEASAYGIELLPWGRRFDQFDEACRIIHSLLTQTTTTFHGEHYQLENARCEPKPIQKPRPPFLIGGGGEKRTLRIAAKYADDWNFPGGSPEQFAHKVAVLHRHCADVGRDPAEIALSTHILAGADVEATAAAAAGMVGAGATHLCLYFWDNRDPSLLGKSVEAVKRAIG